MRNYLFLLGIIFCTCVSAQNVSYVTLRGDTYVMNMIKGWELSTGEKLYKKPARRTVRGYETTQITRICPKNSIKDMGASISIMEFKGCRSYKLIQEQDSLNYLKDTSISSTVWHVQSSEKVKQSVVLTYKANKHPETGENQILKMKIWYVQGKKNTYVISFATAEELIWRKELSTMEKIAFSLEEI